MTQLELENLQLRREMVGMQIAHAATLDAIDRATIEAADVARGRIDLRAPEVSRLKDEFDRLGGEILAWSVRRDG